jgi:hypothetical protein
MNPWPFVIGAYAAALIATVGLTLWSYFGMRRAERDADRLGRAREG